ncbi:MAG: hypothetical protein WB816_11325 [Methylocystis sp.]
MTDPLTEFSHGASVHRYVLGLRGFHMSADMNQNIDMDRNFKATWSGRAQARLAGAALGAALVILGPGAMSEARAQTRTTAAAAAASHDQRSSVSKFEARRIRHTCQERANERSVKGGEREAFLTRCFFGRTALRGIRRDCARQGAAKGLDKPALREFVRECVKEQHAKQKLPD